MREIKFRAWNTKLEKWIDDIDLSMDGVVVLNTAQTFGGAYGHEPILMQYTGLKDKNGKEIYEGDIVKSYMCIKPIVVEYKIYQSDSCCVCGEDHINFAGFEFDSIPKSCLEIIGNIYENPELLNNLTK